MPLPIYSGHSVDCRVDKLKLSASRKRFFTDCDCPIWLTGTRTAKNVSGRPSACAKMLSTASPVTGRGSAAEAKLRSLNAESKDETVH